MKALPREYLTSLLPVFSAEWLRQWETLNNGVNAEGRPRIIELIDTTVREFGLYLSPRLMLLGASEQVHFKCPASTSLSFFLVGEVAIEVTLSESLQLKGYSLGEIDHMRSAFASLFRSFVHSDLASYCKACQVLSISGYPVAPQAPESAHCPYQRSR